MLELILKSPLVATGQSKLPMICHCLSLEKKKEQSSRGLCFNCDETYTPTHVCKRHRLYILLVNNSCLVEWEDNALERDGIRGTCYNMVCHGHSSLAQQIEGRKQD